MGRPIRPAPPGLLTTVAVLAIVAGLVACVGVVDDDLDAASTPTTESAESAPDGAERPAATGEVPAGRDVTVTSITDGDTFRAGDERVRLIGIDTPEITDDSCFGAEATDALGRLIPVGSTVRLVADVQPTDRYDRTLAYVYAPDGTFVNLALALDGFAQPLTVPPNVAHERAFADAAAEARDAGRGLWSACPIEDASTPRPGEPPTSTTAPTPGGGASGSTTAPETGDASAGGDHGCDPAYPDVCIPPSPPDLDCADVPHRRFRVLPPDPHNFDGDGNGLACERV